MRLTQNPTNWGDLPIGTTSLGTTVLRVEDSPPPRVTHVVEDQAAEDAMDNQRLEVVLRVPSRTSMSKTSRVSPLSILRQEPHAGVEHRTEVGEEDVAAAGTIREDSYHEGAVEASILEGAAVARGAQGEGGETGKRYVSRP